MVIFVEVFLQLKSLAWTTQVLYLRNLIAASRVVLSGVPDLLLLKGLCQSSRALVLVDSVTTHSQSGLSRLHLGAGLSSRKLVLNRLSSLQSSIFGIFWILLSSTKVSVRVSYLWIMNFIPKSSKLSKRCALVAQPLISHTRCTVCALIKSWNDRWVAVSSPTVGQLWPLSLCHETSVLIAWVGLHLELLLVETFKDSLVLSHDSTSRAFVLIEELAYLQIRCVFDWNVLTSLINHHWSFLSWSNQGWVLQVLVGWFLRPVYNRCVDDPSNNWRLIGCSSIELTHAVLEFRLLSFIICNKWLDLLQKNEC